MFALGSLGLAATLTCAALLRGGAAAPRGAPPSIPAPEDIVAVVEARSGAASRAATGLAAGDVRARVALARRWIASARRSGDPRQLGRAQAALAPWWDRAELPDEVRLLRATIAQSLHHFADARRDLDALAPRRPNDVQLHLTRAAVAAVTADYPAARQSCEALAASAPPLYVAACKAPVELVSGRADAAYQELAALDATNEDEGPQVRAWSATLLGELAASLGDLAGAERHLRRALAAEPSVYTKAALADLWLSSRRPAEVVSLLADAAEADGLLLRLAIAERRLGLGSAAAHAAQLRERFAATVARGDRTHRREQGLFELDVEGRADVALAHLVENWALQKEPIDALLLLRAAAAAGAPAAAAPVRAWIRATGIRDRAIEDAERALAATGGRS